MSFHAGQKVGCIRDFCGQGDGSTRWPDHIRKGETYTVRDFFLLGGLWPCLYLEEYVAPNCEFSGREIPFVAEHFRAVVERPTDISIFTSLLNTKQREHELT